MMVDFRRSRTRDVGVVLVLALLVVDGVLVVMALRNQPDPPAVTVMDDPPPAAPTESPTTPSPTTTSATPTPTTTTPSPAPTADPVDPGTPRELPLSVLDDQTAVRGTPGSCADGDGSVEITADGGETWTAFEIPDLAVLRVRVTDDDLWFIGADEDCLADLYRGGEEDGNWDSSGSTMGAWHLLGDPEAPEVHAPPDDILPGPCGSVGATVVELESAVGAPARLLCSDGSVHVTNDEGSSWDPVAIVAGARALGIADGSPLVAASGVEGCEGLAIHDVREGEPSQIGCVEGATDDGVALSFAGQVGFLLAGGATWTTGDGGATWMRAA